jgi:pimeloyl-ACP methyl ester carboxylesterase
MHEVGNRDPAPVIPLPAGNRCPIFPAEAPVPREWADRMVNVRRFTKMPKGGHFAAIEEPVLWTKEITAFFYNI